MKKFPSQSGPKNLGLVDVVALIDKRVQQDEKKRAFSFRLSQN
jgi:hypothetical protein